MCQFSAFAENTRDARHGEDLKISRAPHGGSNWLTERGKPNVAVCIPNFATLTVTMPDTGRIRGANFRQIDRIDYLVFVDGKKKKVPLNNMPLGTSVRVLALMTAYQPTPEVQATPGMPAIAAGAETIVHHIFPHAMHQEPVLVGVRGGR